jgi:hypothetical protein
MRARTRAALRGSAGLHVSPGRDSRVRAVHGTAAGVVAPSAGTGQLHRELSVSLAHPLPPRHATPAECASVRAGRAFASAWRDVLRRTTPSPRSSSWTSWSSSPPATMPPTPAPTLPPPRPRRSRSARPPRPTARHPSQITARCAPRARHARSQSAAGARAADRLEKMALRAILHGLWRGPNARAPRAAIAR